MLRKFKFGLRQGLKMLLQNGILPLVYGFWRLIYGSREMDLIIFADAHHDALPPSMVVLYDRMVEKGYDVTVQIRNFARISFLRSTWFSVRFMRLYARAKVVFICDNFLPVSSCRKSERTRVVQLWHACGLMKKMGYDTREDIPAGYKGRVYRNYDLVTVSAPICVDAMAKAMGLAPDIFQPMGVSRTDLYFDEEWRKGCRDEFYSKHPDARGKKLILWAPTFRGNAADPCQVGMEAMQALERQLGEDYFLICKVHPHVDDRYHLSNCDMVTERLLPVVDLLITDYSSVLSEFLLFEKPYVLFAPDLAEYERTRGVYLPYDSYGPCIVSDGGLLGRAVVETLANPDMDWIRRCRELHVSACDGHSTDRLMEYLGL